MADTTTRGTEVMGVGVDMVRPEGYTNHRRQYQAWGSKMK